MRILVIADLHTRDLDLDLLEDPGLDLIVNCGDVYNASLKLILERWSKPILGVHGNHDEPWPEGIIDVHGKTHDHGGLRFGGWEGAWRYKPRGRYLYTDEDVEFGLRGFPRVDVFVAHNPLAGIHDRDDDVHNGFPAFRDYVLKRQPRLFLHGHSHSPGETTLGETRVICVHQWAMIQA